MSIKHPFVHFSRKSNPPTTFTGNQTQSISVVPMQFLITIDNKISKSINATYVLTWKRKVKYNSYTIMNIAVYKWRDLIFSVLSSLHVSLSSPSWEASYRPPSASSRCGVQWWPHYASALLAVSFEDFFMFSPWDYHLPTFVAPVKVGTRIENNTGVVDW